MAGCGAVTCYKCEPPQFLASSMNELLTTLADKPHETHRGDNNQRRVVEFGVHRCARHRSLTVCCSEPLA